MGKAFYKGGFEKTMNKREAALILECSYVLFDKIGLPYATCANTDFQRARSQQRDCPQEASPDDHAKPPRPRRQPLPGDEDQRGEDVFG